MDRLLELLQSWGSEDMADIGVVSLLILLLISLASSIFIAYLYQVFYRSRATGSQVYRSFPLMGISITAIFVSVQFSLPLSLGLLGALSIVRFRTPIKEPEEIGFILLVIATSLSAATFNIVFLGIILVVTVIALLLLRARLLSSRSASDGMLMIGLPAGEAPKLDELISLLSDRLPGGTVDSVSEGEEQLTIAYRFRRLDAKGVPALYASVKELVGSARPSIFFHESSDV